MPTRFMTIGDRHAAIDARAYSLEGLLELSEKHERDGQGDAPWPPQYAKAAGEPPRVQPSRTRAATAAKATNADAARGTTKRPPRKPA
jgi:bifunctional non-homologous end joining protein LigD